MTKIRIYELARELGIENKDVISMAKDLEIPGKVSHSNSLSGDEADLIRRAVIRQAIGSSPAQEIVTKRVNKVTGETDTIVEKRKGNLIRRRRKAEPEPEPDSGAAEPGENLAGQPDSALLGEGVAPEDGEAAHDGQGAEEAAAVGAEAAEDPDQEQPPAAADAAGEHAQAASEAVVVESAEQQGQGTAVEAVEADAAVPGKKTIGPKVLGKIDLPAPRPPREEKPAGRPPEKADSTTGGEEEDEAGSRRKGRRRRSKRREFSMDDLVDYEGQSSKRTGRPGARSGRGSRKASVSNGAISQTEITQPKASKRVIKMDEVITVGELAKQMSVKSGDIIAKLMELGVMATINQAIDQDIATIIAEEFEFQIESVSFDESLILEAEDQGETGEGLPRAPVVTVMGHVDHGKTSLLDKIRSASVAAKEHGGITQHIGAYSVELKNDRMITFIDTPGHAAFTAMRARGADVTDIVVLVVAADDGVMPQTVEAINHAKAAEVPLLVAVNKMDKAGASPDRVKQQLVEHGLQPEEWGGETMFYPVSALTGDGVEALLDGVLLLAEMKELKANPNCRARGTIVEAKQVLGRGSVATVLVQQGTLRVGDIYISGAESGRVRSMMSYRGEKVEEAIPAMPVEITGLTGVPDAGDDFFVVETDALARQVAMNRAQKRRAREDATIGPISLEEFAKRANDMAAAELNVIIKADVHGSVEAVSESIEKLSTDKVKVRVVHAAVGGVTESDVQLAIASRAIIIGFGVRAEPRAINDAETAGIQIRFYRVIYELIDDVKLAMLGLLAPDKEEHALGRVEVRETFSIPKIGTVAGCYVVDGAVRRGAFVRLLRDSKVLHEGKMSSLRRFKDDVKEVQNGYECGIGIDSYNDVKTGDVIEVYEIQEVAPTLE